MESELFFTEATEPTNIIWENRHFTPNQRKVRGVHAVLLITFLVAISFSIIYYCKVTAITIGLKYPNANDCPAINSAYGNEIQYYAFLEYTNFYAESNNNGDFYL